MEISNKLEDHIDDPIKKCTIGLNLLGIKTIYSCCGFRYKNEKVPKSHLYKSYFFIDYSSLTDDLKKILLDICFEAGWIIKKVAEKSGWLEIFGEMWPNNHPWGHPSSPHFYEVYALTINRFEKALESKSELFQDSAVIKDGNALPISNGVKHWLYEPTQDWHVTKQDFFNN